MVDFQKANQAYNATLSGNYTVADTVLSVSSVPANVPTIVTVARDTVKETRFYVTGTGVGQLTGVSRLDGANVNIASGSSVECMNDEEFINQLSAAVFNQSGLKGLVYAADGGGTDAYAISLPVAPTALSQILGLPIAFKANTANTGAATLAVNGLTATAIKKSVSTALSDNDILASQVVIVVYDGTNFQLVSTLPLPTMPTGTVVGTTDTQTLTNKRIEPRVVTAASYTTDTGTSLDVSTADQFQVTAQAGALLFNAPGGTPVAGQKLIIRIKDDGTARALTWNAVFRAMGTALPSTTVLSKTLYLGFIYNFTDTKWDLVASAQEA